MKKNEIDIRQLMEDPEKGKQLIRDGVKRDMEAFVNTAMTIINTPAVFDAYADEVWRRYVAFYEKSKSQPELDLKSNGHD